MTARRCMGFAQSWGFRVLHVVNLFALRSTDPAALLAHPDPEGPENLRYLRETIGFSSAVVAAWGAWKPTRLQSMEVASICAQRGKGLGCLGFNKDGSPKHPLYVAASTKVVAWP